MKEFTKEQLIAEATRNLEALKSFELRHPGGRLLLLNIRLAEITLAALRAEPVALRWRWNDNDVQWTYAPASKMPDFVAAGFSLENGVVVESLYTVSPVQESRTVTVKLPKRSVAEVMLLSGFDRQYAEGWCSGNDNAIHEMRAAGILVIEGEGQ